MNIDINQLEFIDRKLRDVLLFVEKETGIEFSITSLYRIGDTGVHGTLPVRGTDLRMRNLKIGHEIEALVNSNWQYDLTRPDTKCALLHGEGSNLHIHLQVHPNTEKVT